MRRAYLILKVHPDYDNFPIKQSRNSIGYLKSNMSVDTERETDILIINFESINSNEAKESANALAYALLLEDTDYARIEFRNSREFLANQLDEKDRKLRASEEDLRNYKLEHGISMLSEETQELIRQSSELGALLSEAESELEVANNHLSFLQKELSTQDELLSDINSVLTSPLLDQLKEEIVKNQTMYVNLLIKSEYSPDHPEMIALNKGIESAKLRLGEEIQRIITVKAGSSDPLKYRSSLIEKISTAQIDQNINDTKVTSLRKAVGEYNLRMSILPDTEVELARLERNFTINEKVYSMLITKYEDAKIAEESKIGNIRIVEKAQEPPKPIKPNKKMNMIIAFVIGAGLGIGAALLLNSLDSKIRTFDDVRRYVNLSILGTIPYIHISEQDIEDIDKTVKDTETDTKSLEIFKNQIEARLITSYAPKSSASESFRILRTNILAKKKKEESLTALITSAGPKEGKTTIHDSYSF
jgi:tyrosine-protein kinase Etk/Wzc